MANDKIKGLVIAGRSEKAGVTVYRRGEKMVMRSAHSEQPLRRTRAQFEARQRLGHSIGLWRMLSWAGKPMFAGGKNPYARFRSLAMSLPTVYLPAEGAAAGATLLLPDMPVSEGVLPPVKQWLGEVEGRAALLTGLKQLPKDAEMRLYKLDQREEDGWPVLRISMKRLSAADFRNAGGGLALVDDEFGDERKGWALVMVEGDRCSTQRALSNCTLYKRYTTAEAFAAAVASYGGLVE